MLTTAFLLLFIIVQVNSATVPNICTTEMCLNESIRMTNAMDQRVDPCENFYEFACGTFIRETTLPEDKPNVMMIVSEVRDRVDDQLKSALTEQPQPNESKPFRLAKTLTKTCMDEMTLNEKGRRSGFYLYTI